MKRAISFMAAVALVAAAMFAFAPAALADVGDSATGSGRNDVGNTFSFSATGGVDHSGTGTMTVTRATVPGAPAGHDYTATATVRCLITRGFVADPEAHAVIVGTVTSSTVPSHIGQDLVFLATDDGPLDPDEPFVDADKFLDDRPQSPQTCSSYANEGTAGNRVVVGDITIIDAATHDTDDDDVPDAQDNCPLVANPGQQDVDDDNIGDACDPTDDRTAAQVIADLTAQLESNPAGPGNSYLSKLQAIADKIGSGDSTAACNQLDAFVNEVNAQVGKKLTQEQADALLAEVAKIRTKAGCP
jgi:hypothetical protein